MISRLLSKYKALSKPAKASLWFIACYVIQRGLQFIGMPIYTRIMSTEEYGIYSVFLSWFNLICVFSSLNIYSGTFNKAMVKYEEDRDSYISSVLWLTIISSLVFCGFLIAFQGFIQEHTGYGIKYILLMCVHLLMFPPLQYWAQKQRFLFEYKKLVIITLLNSVASLGFGIVFVLLSSDKSYSLVLATVVVQASINIFICVSLAYKGKTFYKAEYWKWSTLTALPLIPHYLSEILLGHADRLMIDQMCGASQAGIYNIVYQISMVMTIIRSGINGSFTPWLYYSLKAGNYKDIRRITKLITLFMGTLTFLFMLIGPEILRIAAPPSYYEAVVGIPAIMIGCFFIFVYVLFLNVEIYFEQNQYVAIASIAAAIINVLLNYICISKFGYLAAAYTTMISYMLMAIMHYYFMLRIIKHNKEIKEVFDVRFILLISIILILFGLILLKLYDFMIIRWVVILFVCVLIFINRNRILTTIRELKRRD